MNLESAWLDVVLAPSGLKGGPAGWSRFIVSDRSAGSRNHQARNEPAKWRLRPRQLRLSLVPAGAATVPLHGAK